MVSSLLNAVLTLVLVALYGHLLMPEVFGLVALTLSLESLWQEFSILV